MDMNLTVKKTSNFINSFQNKGLSPLRIALSLEGFGSISWHPALGFSVVFYTVIIIISVFKIFRPEHH
jgi:hypothetical protein